MGTPVSVISGFLCICLFISLMRNPEINGTIIRKDVLMLTYLSVGCYSFAMVLYTIVDIFVWLDDVIIVVFVISAFRLCYAISSCLIYWLLIFRVYHTFKGTTYGLSRCTYIFSAILVIIFFIVSLMAIAYNYLIIFDLKR